MEGNIKYKRSRGSIPDSLFDAGIDLESFADDLVKKMGFADSKKPAKASRPERPYSYEDTGIIDESMGRTLAMFPDSHGNIAVPKTLSQRQATVTTLSSTTQQATAAPPPESRTYTFKPESANADAYEATEPIDTLLGTSADQTFSMLTPPEQEDAEAQQFAPQAESDPASQTSSRWESVPTQMEFDEEPEPQPKKKRFKLFGATRGAHIRFIIIILGILLLYTLILGFLSYRGVLNIGI